MKTNVMSRWRRQHLVHVEAGRRRVQELRGDPVLGAVQRVEVRVDQRLAAGGAVISL
jgi:hypothetical protein